jgi:hypothetical protein
MYSMAFAHDPMSGGLQNTIRTASGAANNHTPKQNADVGRSSGGRHPDERDLVGGKGGGAVDVQLGVPVPTTMLQYTPAMIHSGVPAPSRSFETG